VQIIKHISYPKSGCQVFRWALLKYFSDNVNYPVQKKDERLMRGREAYYDFLQCKGSLQEIIQNYGSDQLSKVVNAGSMLCSAISESPWLPRFYLVHGHEIEFEDHINTLYLFQYRHPIMCAISWIGWSSDCDAKFMNFVKEKIKKWKVWIHRWVLTSETRPNALCFDYDILVADPFLCFTEVLHFLRVKVDRTHLQRVLGFMNFHHIHTIKDFNVEDVHVKQMIEFEKTIEHELDILKMKKLYLEN